MRALIRSCFGVLLTPMLLWLGLFVIGNTSPARAQGFTTFETGPVRPVALSPDGNTLFVTNIPDNRLEIFDVGTFGLAHRESVPTGLEPCSVAARDNNEVWVVNHLSDSVSIIDVTSTPARVVRTLLVGDEPRDIVFAGAGGNRAFITTSHRGQQRVDASISTVSGAGDPQLTTPGISRADVWVFDATALGSEFGGKPLKIVDLFTDTPRALAVSPDGGTVYAAGFHTGNQTTVVSEGVVCDGFAPFTPCTEPGSSVAAPGGNPGPSTDHSFADAPETGLIVKLDPNSGEFRDELGRDWSAAVLFDLPDRDVFAIDAGSLPEAGCFSSVGTVLFNIIVNPVTGSLYVSNTEARNEVRFEGPGVFGGSTVQGHLAETRVTVITDPNGASAVLPRHLNSHINYNLLAADIGFDPNAKNHSLATPTDMAISADGATLYVAAFGSSKIGVIATAALEAGSFNPVLASPSYISVTGGGPSGIALDEARGRMYVLTRFDNSLAIINLGTGSEVANLPLHSPEPAYVISGRPFLYDAFETSGNGEASCSSCHIFGDFDSLAWDLGNPDDDVKPNPIFINLQAALIIADLVPPDINGTGDMNIFHPMKGPMTTQTLRGLQNSGAMHWRGDRADPGFAVDPNHSFVNFNVAFPGLVGRASTIDPNDMILFSQFAREIIMPPNPVRALDNSLTTDQQNGRDFYLGPRLSDGDPTLPGFSGFTCEGCHQLDAVQGHFGTSTNDSFDGEPQILKIPHLRNMYQKVGMFGMPDIAFQNPQALPHQGDQIRGFGFLHDGSVASLFDFFQAVLFNENGSVGFDGGDAQRRDMEEYMLAFDTDLAPIVGQQITLSDPNDAGVAARIDLLEARAAAAFVSKEVGGSVTECDLIAKASIAGATRGWLYDSGAGNFIPDSTSDPLLSDPNLRALAETAGQELTFTCVPPGMGTRSGIDRDEDALLDADDACPSNGSGDHSDADSDGRGAVCDNCAFRANSTQTDVGGVGTGSLADGIGDECQCGHLAGTGVVNDTDIDTLRTHLADPSGSPLGAAADRCSVTGGSTDCDILTFAVLKRAIQGLAPGASQTCAAAVSL